MLIWFMHIRVYMYYVCVCTCIFVHSLHCQSKEFCSVLIPCTASSPICRPRIGRLVSTRSGYRKRGGNRETLQNLWTIWSRKLRFQPIQLRKRVLWSLFHVTYYSRDVVFRQSEALSKVDVKCRLHWLPVRQRTLFKVLVLTYCAVTATAPNYLLQLLHHRNVTRTLRPCPHDTFPNWARSIATSSRPVARVHTGAIGTLVPDPRDHLSTWNEWARSIAIGRAQSSLSCGCSSGRYRPVIMHLKLAHASLTYFFPSNHT